ncbi:hypothetical protein M011DRAFT_474818 [Sporormia fimetaria CBS 119925]|uniref:Sensitive to high expression protein 9, mitochondrial n=1 Tax=Sporormia fimetaria CBS 119925 TaxID=1340428 RepID=A0A6A6VMJ2_9PLEO|nr:hypothetical protein M011DRAFT_474818 [Sporormia fimetaria CBS 119925]
MPPPPSIEQHTIKDAAPLDQDAIKDAAPKEDPPSTSAEPEPEPTPQPSSSPEPETSEPPPSMPHAPPRKPATPVEDTIERVPAEKLPSHRERLRWNVEKRINEFMDELLPKLAVVTQKVNTYTGTDYSSIAALKQEIKDQEQLVKARRHAIEEAKQALDAAHAQQGASQKEVVALLERKHSWSAADLERYMSLIRSEHLNDQAIREAKEAVTAAENALEEARSQLEKRERAQYHEEQIWSDTIRRNSTWVTFGLMGLNIFLLLASLVIFEPWRRRRMVKEIKAALAEAQLPVVAAAAPAPATVLPHLEVIEAEIDKVMDEFKNSEHVASQEDTTAKPVAPVPETPESVQTETIEAIASADPVAEEQASSPQEVVEEVASTNIPFEATRDSTRLELITAKLEDLVSDEEISVRKKDLTIAVCAGAAAGWVLSLIVFWATTR